MNKKIVITGATKGIGKAIAEKFAAHGFDLALCARNVTDLEKLKLELSVYKTEIMTEACDVSKKQQVQHFAQSVLSKFGAVDVLINNAGVFIPGQLINEADGTLEHLIETNLYSAYYLSRALLPKMITNNSAHIFNICSVASVNSYPNGGSYSISKFAMLGLSKALREELKELNVKVTALLPGATLTDSWKGTNLPTTRFMKPEDLATLIFDIYNLSEQTVVEEVLLRPMLGDV